MHYLMIANSPFTIVNFRKELISSLVKRGNEVTIVCPLDCSIMEYDSVLFSDLNVRFHPVKFSRTSLSPFGVLKLYKSLVNTIEDLKPDVILNYTVKPTVFGSIAAGLVKKNIKVYSNITGLGYVFTGSSFKHKFLEMTLLFLYRLAFKYNDKVFFQNIDDLNLFVERNIIDRNKAILINGSGVDTSYFDAEARKYTDSGVNVLFVGRLLKDKGIYEYLGAAEELSKTNSDIKFHIAGSFDENPASLAPRELKDYEVRGVIKYHGNVKDVKSLLERADIFVLPSYREGTPRSTLEAMSMSKPIITTNVPGCKETVVDGRNGILIPPKSVSDLVDAIKFFISNKSKLVSYGECSRMIALERYDVNKVNKVILDVICDNERAR